MSGGLGSGSGSFLCEGDCEEDLASGGEVGDCGGAGGFVVGRFSSSAVGERTWDSETRTAFLRSYFGD